MSSYACVDMLNVIYTFSLLIEEASNIVLVCAYLWRFLAFCSFVLANVMHCDCVVV